MLFSGAALLVNILGGVSLPLALGTGAAVALAAARLVWRTLDDPGRSQAAARLRIGLIAGVAATVAYDAAKYGLAQIDGSDFNPFGAMETFGALLVGQTAPGSAHLAAGIGFHILNGVLFGVAFVFLFGSRGILAGVAWGLFLEAFQITLYPGWLDIRAYREFATISALGHVVYGASLGMVARSLLVRSRIEHPIESQRGARLG